MCIAEKINALKNEYEKKYKIDRMDEILKNGYFEKETSIAKSEITEITKKQMEIMAEIYNRYMELVHEKGYDIVYDEYAKRYELHQQDRELYYRPSASEKTRNFLDNFNDPFEDIIDYHNIIVNTYLRYKNSFSGLAKGDQGETYVNEQLALFQGKYKYAQNIKLSNIDFKGKTSETDLYVITSKGILVCEIKNKGNKNYRFKISKDGQWRKEKGNSSEVMESPFTQNTRHCIATERLLEENGITDYKIIPVVIIANEKVEIENHSENAVIRISELYNFVENLSAPESYTQEYQNKILELLEENNIKGDNYFTGYMVDSDMMSKTVTYAKYLLEMMGDTESLLNEIRNLEEQMVKKRVYQIDHKNRRKNWIRFAVEIFLFWAAINVESVIWIAVVGYGICIWLKKLKYDTQWEEQNINMKHKILSEGDY